jgi:hypothetical protein
MAYDFLKNFMMFEDEDRFGRLCQAVEDAIREFEETEGKFSDAEIMQMLDAIGFNLFRDSWEEFKKLELHRDLSTMGLGRGKPKKLIN